MRTGLGLKVDYLPHPLDVLGAGVEVDDIEGVTVFWLYPPVLPPLLARASSGRWTSSARSSLLVLAAPLMLPSPSP